MTVSTTTLNARYNGNGSTTAFSTGFSFSANSEVKVTLYNSAGVGTVKTITTHYTVTGAGTGNAGTVTMLTAPAVNEVLLLELNVPLTQTYDYQNNSKFPNETTEAALDKAIRIAQMQQSQIDRALKVTGASEVTGIELPAPEAGKAIAGNATNDGYVNLDLGSLGSTTIIDEDNMASNSAAAVPTQQSVKAYVDAASAAALIGQPTLIGTKTLVGITAASATTGVDINGYDYIKVDIVGFLGDDPLFIQTSVDNSTWKTAAGDYKTTSTDAIGFKLTDDQSARNQYAQATLFGMTDTNAYSTFWSKNISVATAGNASSETEYVGCRQAKTNDRYIRFILGASGTTCTAGTAYIYGANYD